ncbi:MAG TPA: transglutaminase-like domain-containing protein [Feifaniaceae bacterium]|nr:transglutaminase-like domain-containing protein [Feifaniaceae bacterium]
MKKGFRSIAYLMGVAFLFAVLPVGALAATGTFDLSNVSAGHIAVWYESDNGKALKVGMRDDDTRMIQYYDYVSGTRESFPLPEGAQNVTALLYENISGNSYRKLDSVTFINSSKPVPARPIPAAGNSSAQNEAAKNLPSGAAKYLGSVTEISFRAGDSVSGKAAELTAGKGTTQEKAMAIYSYIVKNFSYDYDLYYDVIEGRVTRYTPNPSSILKAKKGICYDIASLYAAMCRSVGIPAKMVKGDSKPAGGYHAWNSVYDDASGEWVSMDLTLDMSNRRGGTSKWRTIGSGYSASSSV